MLTSTKHAPKSVVATVSSFLGLGLALILCSGCEGPIQQPSQEPSVNASSFSPPTTYAPPTQSAQVILGELTDRVAAAGGNPVGEYQLQQSTDLEVLVSDSATHVGVRVRCASDSVEWEVKINGDDGRWARSTCTNDSADYDGSFVIQDSDEAKIVITVTITNNPKDQSIFLVAYWNEK